MDQNNTMRALGFQSDELKLFHRVLRDVMNDIASTARDIPVHDITKRLFAAAEAGERDPIKLRSATLGADIMVVQRPHFSSATRNRRKARRETAVQRTASFQAR